MKHQKFKKILMHTGRVFLALYFLLPGISKFTSWESSSALMEAHNMVMIPFLLTIAGIMQVLGGISLLLNSCLLYTSPSPRDAHESRMPSSA